MLGVGVEPSSSSCSRLEEWEEIGIVFRRSSIGSGVRIKVIFGQMLGGVRGLIVGSEGKDSSELLLDNDVYDRGY